MRGLGTVLAAGVALGSLLPGAVTPVSAQIYRWTDERGEVRYSQGIHSIPPQFRGGAVMMSPPSQPSWVRPMMIPTPRPIRMSGQNRQTWPTASDAR